MMTEVKEAPVACAHRRIEVKVNKQGVLEREEAGEGGLRKHRCTVRNAAMEQRTNPRAGHLNDHSLPRSKLAAHNAICPE